MGPSKMDEDSQNSLRQSLMTILYELKSIQNRTDALLIGQWDVAPRPGRQRLYFEIESTPCLLLPKSHESNSTGALAA
jgi:hypothetical protein